MYGYVHILQFLDILKQCLTFDLFQKSRTEIKLQLKLNATTCNREANKKKYESFSCDLCIAAAECKIRAFKKINHDAGNHKPRLTHLKQ